jgi:uncharacterized protein (TIGR03435 family)
MQAFAMMLPAMILPAMLLLSALTFVQERATFEVASVKLVKDGRMSIDTPPSGRFNATLPVNWLLRMAYNLPDVRIVGVPRWAETDYYQIIATPPAMKPAATQEEWRKESQERLRSLLEDRFQFKSHSEMRELPVYELSVAKGGAKLQETEASEPGKFRLRLGRGKINTEGGAKIAMLVNLLQNQLGRVVLDQTGLTGYYPIHLEYNTDDTKSGELPSLSVALQEQLGLKLESKKRMIEVLVIDQIERPTEN